MVIPIISYVGGFGKSFSVDSSLSVFLISFLAHVSKSGLNFLFDRAGVRLVLSQRDLG